MKKVVSLLVRVRQTLVDWVGVLLSSAKEKKGPTAATGKRVTFVQFGDYAEGYWRLKNGGEQNYYAQKYTVDYVGSLPGHIGIEAVTVICVSSDANWVTLPNGIQTAGLILYPEGRRARHEELLELVKRSKPTHLIAMIPCIPLISWGVRAGCNSMPMLADSFRATGLKARIEYKLLGRLFNVRAIEVVANHNLAASLDLVRIGVSSEKVVPFDWPALISPRDFEAKNAPQSKQIFRLLYVGSVIESKGVGDVIRAIAVLRSRGASVGLTVIGRGEIDKFKGVATSFGVQEFVLFLGPKSHSDVIAAMRDHDVVIVPSRWSYPEGLPMTLYEALCTRTPLLTSDHPMFALKIHDRYNALVFPERDAEECARRVEELVRSPDLYSQLSSNALAAADEYLCALKYDQLIAGFLGLNSGADLRQFSLAKCYPEQVSRALAAKSGNY